MDEVSVDHLMHMDDGDILGSWTRPYTSETNKMDEDGKADARVSSVFRLSSPLP